MLVSGGNQLSAGLLRPVCTREFSRPPPLLQMSTSMLLRLCWLPVRAGTGCRLAPCFLLAGRPSRRLAAGLHALALPCWLRRLLPSFPYPCACWPAWAAELGAPACACGPACGQAAAASCLRAFSRACRLVPPPPLLTEFRNAAALLALPESQQFQFLHHRVYIMLDELVGRHKVGGQGNGRYKMRFMRCSRGSSRPIDRCPPTAPAPSPPPHQVYKLFGSPFGFMLSTNVAEPDPQHATTLLACARELLEQLEQASGAECGSACSLQLAGGADPAAC